MLFGSSCRYNGQLKIVIFWVLLSMNSENIWLLWGNNLNLVASVRNAFSTLFAGWIPILQYLIFGCCNFFFSSFHHKARAVQKGTQHISAIWLRLTLFSLDLLFSSCRWNARGESWYSHRKRSPGITGTWGSSSSFKLFFTSSAFMIRFCCSTLLGGHRDSDCALENLFEYMNDKRKSLD